MFAFNTRRKRLREIRETPRSYSKLCVCARVSLHLCVCVGPFIRPCGSPTQYVQGALVVGDDDVGSLCLQVFQATHIEPQTQEVLNMANQSTDHPGDRKEHSNVQFNLDLK